jgi:hypothetical protein
VKLNAPSADLVNSNAKIVILAALASIQRECEGALDRPETSCTSIRRIASLACQALHTSPGQVISPSA